jgi:hypothetical protein
MGLKDYFRAKPPVEASADPPAIRQQPLDDLDLRPPFMPGSGSGSTSGVGSSRSSAFMIDDIKHEVMVNYLHQQQCSNLWINLNAAPGESSGDEGVLLRKSKGHYIACPVSLNNSLFTEACVALNVHVSFSLPLFSTSIYSLTNNFNQFLSLGCYDR